MGEKRDRPRTNRLRARLVLPWLAASWLGLVACGAQGKPELASADEESRLGASPFCPERHGDCDRDSENGCETDLSFDVDNCGLCGQSCDRPHFDGMCNDGRCSGRCELHYCDEDGDLENGCEKGPQKEKEPRCTANAAGG